MLLRMALFDSFFFLKSLSNIPRLTLSGVTGAWALLHVCHLAGYPVMSSGQPAEVQERTNGNKQVS